MFKILIADDEPKIRRGLRSEIEDMGLDITVCAEAGDGRRALELVDEFLPDIILVDICMPFMNGLEFIKRVNDKKHNCKIIIITGHDEFSYAYESIKLNVFAFLLKPLDTYEMESTIKNAIASIVATQKQAKSYEWAMLQINKRKQFLIEQFFSEWLCGRLSNEEAQEQISYYDLKFDKKSCLILASYTFSADNGTIWDKRLLEFAIMNITNELLEQKQPCHVFLDDRENVMAIANLNDKNIEEFAALMRTTMSTSLDKTVVVEIMPIPSIEKIGEIYYSLYEKISTYNSYSSYVKNAQNYINKNYRNPNLNLQQVANSQSLNPAYLSRLMKQETGLSFTEYLTTLRINKAIELMQDKNLLLKRVAIYVGYSNQYYFSTAFKKVAGVSPINYNKEKE